MKVVPLHTCDALPISPEGVRTAFAKIFSEAIQGELGRFDLNAMLSVTLHMPLLILVFIGMKAGGILSNELFLFLTFALVLSFHLLLVLGACVDTIVCARAYRRVVRLHPLLMLKIRASHAALWRIIDSEDRDEPIHEEEPLKMAA